MMCITNCMHEPQLHLITFLHWITVSSKKKTTKEATITDQLASVKDCRLAPASPALVELCMHARLYKHRCI